MTDANIITYVTESKIKDNDKNGTQENLRILGEDGHEERQQPLQYLFS